MNKLGSSTAVEATIRQFANPTPRQPSEQELLVRETFQEFVAGTFYSQMLKSLHKMHDKPAYFHGGSAEGIFQSQLDQQVAEDLAKQDGAALSADLLSAFAQRHGYAALADRSASAQSAQTVQSRITL